MQQAAKELEAFMQTALATAQEQHSTHTMSKSTTAGPSPQLDSRTEQLNSLRFESQRLEAQVAALQIYTETMSDQRHAFRQADDVVQAHEVSC